MADWNAALMGSLKALVEKLGHKKPKRMSNTAYTALVSAEINRLSGR